MGPALFAPLCARFHGARVPRVVSTESRITHENRRDRERGFIGSPRIYICNLDFSFGTVLFASSPCFRGRSSPFSRSEIKENRSFFFSFFCRLSKCIFDVVLVGKNTVTNTVAFSNNLTSQRSLSRIKSFRFL
ncbi:hypothetical protein PUN28_004126 [Cardiocondyla obscurior]|uniref:Secreted protein n=1 Tax=Cardiocondyla obscurior TaxID=286306 RepID=A0AAW2GPQ6_9HYME